MCQSWYTVCAVRAATCTTSLILNPSSKGVWAISTLCKIHRKYCAQETFCVTRRPRGAFDSIYAWTSAHSRLRPARPSQIQCKRSGLPILFSNSLRCIPRITQMRVEGEPQLPFVPTQSKLSGFSFINPRDTPTPFNGCMFVITFALPFVNCIPVLTAPSINTQNGNTLAHRLGGPRLYSPTLVGHLSLYNQRMHVRSCPTLACCSAANVSTCCTKLPANVGPRPNGPVSPSSA